MALVCCAEAQGVVDFVPKDAQRDVPQPEVFEQEQTTAIFNPAAIEEFVKALHGRA